MTLANTNQIADIANSVTWGIEIEISTHSTRSAANAMARAWDTADSISGPDGYYETYKVADPNGKVWSVVTDGSLPDGCEIVSPICRGLSRMDGDMANLLDMLGACKFKVSSEHGVHVHIGVGDYSPRVVQALIKTVGESQDMIAKMAAGTDARYEHMINSGCGAHHLDNAQINRVVRAEPTWEALRKAWYGDYAMRYGTPWTDRYHQSRYVGVNLHSTFVEIHGDAPRRTVEFRYFCADRKDAPQDSYGRRGVHRGKVRSAITFAAYMVARSIYNVSQGRLPRTVRRNADKATARTFFNWLRMYDRAVIEHLIAALPGEYTNGHNHNRGRGMGPGGIVPGCSCARCTEGAGSAEVGEAQEPATF